MFIGNHVFTVGLGGPHWLFMNFLSLRSSDSDSNFHSKWPCWIRIRALSKSHSLKGCKKANGGRGTNSKSLLVNLCMSWKQGRPYLFGIRLIAISISNAISLSEGMLSNDPNFPLFILRNGHSYKHVTSPAIYYHTIDEWKSSNIFPSKYKRWIPKF